MDQGKRMTYSIRTLIREPEPVEIERLAAADLVLAARRAEQLSKLMPVDEREQYVKRFEALILDLELAKAAMRKAGPPEPDFIPTYLRAESQAAFHD